MLSVVGRASGTYHFLSNLLIRISLSCNFFWNFFCHRIGTPQNKERRNTQSLQHVFPLLKFPWNLVEISFAVGSGHPRKRSVVTPNRTKMETIKSRNTYFPLWPSDRDTPEKGASSHWTGREGRPEKGEAHDPHDAGGEDRRGSAIQPPRESRRGGYGGRVCTGELQPFSGVKY